MHSDHRHAPAWGLLLTGIGVAAIGWLAVTGQLGLYIHPRYFEFTVVMAGLAAIAAVATFAGRGRSAAPGRGLGAAIAAGALACALLVVPPATLTSATVQQRALNSSVDTAESIELVGADPSQFRLRDWARLVTDPSGVNYAGQQVTLVGFVTPAPGHPDTFYLARFVLTCCTVDAQPVGVPVAAAGWAEKYQVDQWLEVTGNLVAAPDAPGGAVLEIQPTAISIVPQPAQPYEY